MLKKAAGEKIPEQLARIFAAAAFELNLPRLGIDFLAQIDDEHAAKTLEQYGQKALGQGEYGLAAEYFLMARDQANDQDEARRLFQKGVGALMAANQFRQAMLAADRHLGNLKSDPVTLRYLARAALAAGEPAQAARYARQLVFQADKAPSTP
jgi:tetratricopeptide (TPR) repeat protein